MAQATVIANRFIPICYIDAWFAQKQCLPRKALGALRSAHLNSDLVLEQPKEKVT